MNASFKLDAKSVKQSTINLEKAVGELKNKSLEKELDHLDSTVKLIEKLSIINEYKLNIFLNKVINKYKQNIINIYL